MDCSQNSVFINDSTITLNNPVMFRKYIHHIRNLNTLDANMMKNIRNMSDDEKIHIILALNDVVRFFLGSSSP